MTDTLISRLPDGQVRFRHLHAQALHDRLPQLAGPRSTVRALYTLQCESPFRARFVRESVIDVHDATQKRKFSFLNMLLKPSLPPRKGGPSVITKVTYGSVVALVAFLTVWLKDGALSAKTSGVESILPK